MVYELTEKDKAWIEEAHIKGFTYLQMIKKLQGAGYNRDRIDAFIEYMDEFEEEQKRIKSSDKKAVEKERKEEENRKEDEKKFEKSVRDYQEGKKLGFWEKREVTKWLKNMDKLLKYLKVTIEEIKKEYMKLAEKQSKGVIKAEKELNDLKREIAERIMDLKEAFIIEDPNTGEEATKESLMECSIDQLLELLEENVATLEVTVNGKIQKE